MQGPTGHRGDPRTIDRLHEGAVAFRYGDVGHLGGLLGEAGQDALHAEPSGQPVAAGCQGERSGLLSAALRSIVRVR